MPQGGYYISSEDGINIYFRYYNSGVSNLCLCLLHGWGSDSSEFDPLIKYMCENGVSVSAIDLRGHGKSEGDLRHVRKIQVLINDVKVLIEESVKLFNSSRIILLGHQWSALLALKYYFFEKNKINGLILSAPLFKPSQTKLKLSLLYSLINNIFPFLTVNLRNIWGEKYFEKVVNRHISIINARLLRDWLNIGKKMIKLGYKINTPMLVMHGTLDEVSMYKASITFSRNTGVYTSFKSWYGKGHNLFNNNNVDVFEYILNWLISHFKK